VLDRRLAVLLTTRLASVPSTHSPPNPVFVDNLSRVCRQFVRLTVAVGSLNHCVKGPNERTRISTPVRDSTTRGRVSETSPDNNGRIRIRREYESVLTVYECRVAREPPQTGPTIRGDKHPLTIFRCDTTEEEQSVRCLCQLGEPERPSRISTTSSIATSRPELFSKTSVVINLTRLHLSKTGGTPVYGRLRKRSTPLFRPLLRVFLKIVNFTTRREVLDIGRRSRVGNNNQRITKSETELAARAQPTAR
jgi:hypothetical protein